MPELPDVEVFRRYLNSTSLHSTITALPLIDRDMLAGVSSAKLKKTLTGNRFTGTARHGKYLFAQMDRGGVLVLHFGMTGFLKYFKNSDSEPGHPRLEIAFSDGYRLACDAQRKLGRISLAADAASFVRGKKLGPDVLDKDFDRKAFAECLRGSRAAVKSALMNQHDMAGIGNVYSDEILFQAGVHPALKASRLKDGQVRTLYSAMKRVLATAVERRADPGKFPASYLVPRRGRDGNCPKCGAALKSAKISGRTARYCPRCQKKSAGTG